MNNTTITTPETENGEKYILEVNNLKEYFPISKSFLKKNIVYLKAVDGVSFKLKR